MNILLYSNFFWPSIGGVEVVTRNIAKTLVKHNHKITVLTSTRLPGDNNELIEGYNIVRELSANNFYRLIKNADLVLCIGDISRKIALVSAIVGTPYIVWYQMLKTSKGPYAYDKIDKLLKKTVAGFLACSKACLESHDVHNNKKCLGHIYNPVSEDLSSSADASLWYSRDHKEFDILFVGRLIRGKGIFVLCDALELLIGQGLAPRVAFVGVGPEENELLNRIKELNRLSKKENIAFLGRKEGKGLSDVYQRSRMLIIPTSSHPEGMGIVIAEAVMFGLPVIGSSQPAIKEVIADAGLIFDNHNASDLAEKIFSLLENESIYEAISTKAKVRSKDFHINQFEEKLTSILQLY
ncbi:MAG: glycosyltransferase family 4 protein [Cyclobacteriaceae bacterium]